MKIQELFKSSSEGHEHTNKMCFYSTYPVKQKQVQVLKSTPGNGSETSTTKLFTGEEFYCTLDNFHIEQLDLFLSIVNTQKIIPVLNPKSDSGTRDE